MHLEEILRRNRNYSQARPARPLPPPQSESLAVIACYDPRLDGMLRPALGLGEGEGLLLRTPGALLGRQGEPLRYLVLAVYLFGVTEVIVLGHSSCRMAAFDTAAFIEAFRRRGVPRQAFGDGDLRSWAGAIPNPRQGVQESLAAISGSPLLPRDLSVAGLLLDDTTGAVELVVRPGEPLSSASPPPAEAATTEPAASIQNTALTGVAAPAQPQTPSWSPGSPSVTPTHAPGAPPVPPDAHTSPAPPGGPGAQASTTQAGISPEGIASLVESLQRLIGTLESTGRWREEIRQLRQELERERNPFARFRLLERFLESAARDSRDVAAAFERLKREALGRRGRHPAG